MFSSSVKLQRRNDRCRLVEICLDRGGKIYDVIDVFLDEGSTPFLTEVCSVLLLINGTV